MRDNIKAIESLGDKLIASFEIIFTEGKITDDTKKKLGDMVGAIYILAKKDNVLLNKLMEVNNG